TAGATPGAAKALEILRKEFDLVMGQMGCPAQAELGPEYIFRP
ncbi:MAG: alpha-hydroxy-acid oxidizing protein, partial [Alphaproteobacteria bacterium]|nr:alpha-hydroxy-acid oxidizing protein [Alphaproteobacteria bacterium]